MVLEAIASKKNSKLGEGPKILLKMASELQRIYSRFGVIVNVFEDEYEGGDFCAGLTVGYEMRQLVTTLSGWFMQNMWGTEQPKNFKRRGMIS